MNMLAQEQSEGPPHFLFDEAVADIPSSAFSSAATPAVMTASQLNPGSASGALVPANAIEPIFARRYRYVGACSVSLALHGILFLFALQEARTSSAVAPPPIRITLLTTPAASERAASSFGAESSPVQPKPIDELRQPVFPTAVKPEQRPEQQKQPHKQKSQGQALTRTMSMKSESKKLSPPPSSPFLANEEQVARLTNETGPSVTAAEDSASDTEAEPLSRSERNVSIPFQGGGHESSPIPANQAAGPPVLIAQVAPRYPERARLLGIEGLVRLEAILDREGHVEAGIKILESIPLLDEAASTAVRQWRFRPARDPQGRPIRVILEVPLRFVLK
jgi:periplasmic protein TonB